MNSSVTLSSKAFASRIRYLSLMLVNKAKASHIASALSIADILATLYSDNKYLNLVSPEDPNRDRFLLSKGHACVALYVALHLKGFYSYQDLFTYGSDFSVFMNHASHFVDGVEFSTGALGHALPIACGKALKAKQHRDPWHIFVLLSDGELQEGSNWEAFLFANQFCLSNLTVLVDYNNLQSLTTVDETIALSPLNKKLESFGFKAFIVDGHDHKELKKAILNAKNSLYPSAIICKTVKGKGVSYMENNIKWHYKSPSDDELSIALAELAEQ